MAEGSSPVIGIGKRLRRRKRKSENEIVKVEISDSSSSSLESIVEVINILKEHPESIVPEAFTEPSSVECAVCLQVCVHPARLPCGHIFCFLCLKGIANQSKRCAMCRQEIPTDYLERPDLVTVPGTAEREDETFEDGYQWFYEGRNGWWQYEERMSQDLEQMYKMGEKSFETIICGTLYIIDFQALIQYNKNHPRRKRRIKRELVSNITKKGIAGIR